ncbi:MAG: Na(+)/H(+) antiporter subunit D [Gammaproteobacteria bacterium]|nr:Na(+)/H(+) antiporter subunit D [Gammaproteobacteria bacterium]MCY4165347.1 Na(+)/H(+) antiporter subunit D [Gammaproteobacteria bacterium]MCY4255664.1 Na(+)/H(+) antiporter subunit D [Gammaproteobacteria bacterium]MCY4340318.1 Na(+)/H(+) antiporter subunit D [Gammaproteobacteria bacterium]
MIFEPIPPALALLLGGALIGILRGHARSAMVLLAPLLTLWLVWLVPDGVALDIQFLDYRIEPLEGSPVRRLFATAFALMAFVGGLFAYRQAKWHELAAAHIYAAGAIGVCFAGDLITLFIFWELMALFSTVVVWCGGSPGARAAGIRYAIMHLLGGVILKVGIEGVAVHTGSIDVQAMLAGNFDAAMILTGILINAAAPPVSAWLSDSYPESSPTGSVFLSAFTTKTAVLALILLFPGEPLLIGIGLFMVMYGIIYALLENNIRRILAFSIVNQVGFMVCAVGIGTEMAINGAAAHAFAHIIYKALLFMSAGVVVHRTGLNRCSDVGGLFRTMPLTAICGIVGALAISGFPLTSGFTTKTLISQAAANEAMVFVYFTLAAASAGVFLHAGIKFPWFVFFQRDSGLRPKDAPWNMAAAMLMFAFLCVLLGVAPELLYRFLPYPVDYDAYAPDKVLFYLQLLLFSGLAFFLLLPLMRRTRTISLDADWLWRVLLFEAARRAYGVLGWMGARAAKALMRISNRLRRLAARHMSTSSDGQRSGVFARTWPIGTTAIWIAILLTSYVFVYYL